VIGSRSRSMRPPHCSWSSRSKPFVTSKGVIGFPTIAESLPEIPRRALAKQFVCSFVTRCAIWFLVSLICYLWILNWQSDTAMLVLLKLFEGYLMLLFNFICRFYYFVKCRSISIIVWYTVYHDYLGIVYMWFYLLYVVDLSAARFISKLCIHFIQI